jgi:hypothetical protein
VKRAAVAAFLGVLGPLGLACSSPAQVATTTTTTSKPDPAAGTGQPARLVVLVVIDQLPQWALQAKRPALTRGFARVLAEGEWRTGRHPSIATLTAPGHALLGTGEPPARSGILANEWWSREDGRIVKSTEGQDGNTSSHYLRVPGLGDAIAATGRGGKAVGVSLKNRAALLPLGHRGLAVFYDAASGSWLSHGDAALAPADAPRPPARPDWLASYEREHPIAARLAPWTPSDPARLAQLSGTIDAQPGEVGEWGFGPTFPHDPRTLKRPTGGLMAMPLGNDVVFEIATAAIAGEQLGGDDAADLLVLSLSAHDYIAHGWGHESWEAWDTALQLDARLDTFLADLDRLIGPDRWAMVITSDHGGSPLPERSGGGRMTYDEIARAANHAASTVLGPGNWIASASFPNVYLTPAAAKSKDADKALRKITLALRSFPGLALVDRTDAYAGNCDARTGDAQAICLALHPQLSGELFYVPAPGWIMERYATSHGSLYDYDRDVPVIVLAPDRAGRGGKTPATVPGSTMSLAGVAPLLAQWLDVSAPHTLPR